MSYHSGFDWSSFKAHFVFGAIVGAIIGVGWWLKSPDASSASARDGLPYIIGGALIVGLVAAFLGEFFWRRISDWFGW